MTVISLKPRDEQRAYAAAVKIEYDRETHYRHLAAAATGFGAKLFLDNQADNARRRAETIAGWANL